MKQTVELYGTRASPPFRELGRKDFRLHIAEDIVRAGLAQRVEADGLKDMLATVYDANPYIAIYGHILWCFERCTFCHYRRSDPVGRTEMKRYVSDLFRHLEMMRSGFDFDLKIVRSIYIGGGTPTMLPVPILSSVLETFCEVDGARNAEVTIEASVDTLDDRRLAVATRHANRLSVGVQSFNDTFLHALGRTHTRESAVATLQRACQAIAHVNIDLLYGLEGQTLAHWMSDIDVAVDIRIPSITLYRLEFRRGLPERQKFDADNTAYASFYLADHMYLSAREALISSGYREALTGWFIKDPIRDVEVYRARWQDQVPCIGIGPGAHSYGREHFMRNVSDSYSYSNCISDSVLPVSEAYSLTVTGQLVWYVWCQIRSNTTVSLSEVEHKFGARSASVTAEFFSACVDLGLVVQLGPTFETTSLGKAKMESLLRSYMEFAVDKLGSSPQVFDRTGAGTSEYS